MTRILLVACVSLATLSFVLPEARAHGGGSFRGPGGVVPPGLRGPPPAVEPVLPCDCAGVDCPHCSDGALRDDSRIRTRRRLTSTLERWGDVARVRTTLRFRERPFQGRGVTEARATVRHAPLFAVTGGRIQVRGVWLAGRLAPARGARRDYLWVRQEARRTQRAPDPLLVVRSSTAAVGLRAFPVERRRDTVVEIEGYALVDDYRVRRTRLYRTGARFLAVVPQRGLVPGDAPDFLDEVCRRALFFLSEDEAHERFGLLAFLAAPVPFVGALEAAVRGSGPSAVSRTQALVALPAGRGAPQKLAVRHARDAWRPGELTPAVAP